MQTRKLDVEQIEVSDNRQPLNMASDGEDPMQDSIESPRNKSLLTKKNQIVTPDDGRQTSI